MKLHFTPTYSSWLNQVEIWFARLEREVIARLVGEQDQLGCFGRDRANIVHVDEALQLRQNIGVESVAEKERARIDEIRLAFRFTGSEIDHQTIALFKINRRAGEIESLMREKTEWSSDKKRPIKHGIESGRVRIGRIVVAARVKDRQFVAHPIFVD